MRKDYEDNVTTVFTTYFHLLGVSFHTPPDIEDYKIVTNHSSFTQLKISRDVAIIKHHHKSLPAIFVSERICSPNKL